MVARRIAVALLFALGVVAAGCENRGAAVHASGTIEMDETDVASLVGGRLKRLTVNEGDSVTVGDTLAVLDRGEITADFRAQLANADRAAAQSRDVSVGPRAEEIRIARAQSAAATARRDLAQREFERGKTLFADRVIPAAEFERLSSNYEAALATEGSTQHALTLLEEGSRRNAIAAAASSMQAARETAAAARSRVDELVLTAPISGVVLLKNFERGELVQAGQPVVTLGNPDSLWIRVYVAAPNITRVRRGAAAEIQLGRTNPRRYAGRVVEIGSRAEFTPRAALTEEERANIVFAVKIALDPSGGELKAGLPADAIIQSLMPPGAADRATR
ncbi:MAG: HlyD family efflux transporter periplasmic adaptor subunit [Candidatus Eisenbacteria bacterium]|uniref:HlyD family efflux transporter periplasmic adaptor subunit n=1 Tax=Eiseniibacteriota bacterium TaxID=2212470 RepID=A0A849SPR4_UNCEI|nr:HlyD family efflux transporter periplasmic adaptor subunit [Candidatus Eisenbacteria bacterium]